MRYVRATMDRGFAPNPTWPSLTYAPARMPLWRRLRNWLAGLRL
jgi:hypothetical protein